MEHLSSLEEEEKKPAADCPNKLSRENIINRETIENPVPGAESEEQKEPSHLFRYIGGYFVYILLILPVTLILLMIPAVDTEWELYQDVFKRRNYYSTHFSFAKLLLWCTLCIVGFTYISIVTLGSKDRKNPFVGRNGNYRDIIILISIAPLLYFTAPLIFLRDRFDMEKDGHEPAYLIQSTQLYDEDVNNIFTFNWGDRFADLPMSYYESFDGEYHCNTFDVWEVFWYNYTLCLFYFLGLNYTHLGKIPIPHLSLSADKIKKWGWLQYTFIGTLMIVLLTIIISVFTMYYYAGILLLYGCILVGFILFLVGAILIPCKTYSFHFHHYLWGFFLMVLGGYQHMYVSILGALMAGIMIEGVSRWGFDPWWTKK